MYRSEGNLWKTFFSGTPAHNCPRTDINIDSSSRTNNWQTFRCCYSHLLSGNCCCTTAVNELFKCSCCAIADDAVFIPITALEICLTCSSGTVCSCHQIWRCCDVAQTNIDKIWWSLHPDGWMGGWMSRTHAQHWLRAVHVQGKHLQ